VSPSRVAFLIGAYLPSRGGAQGYTHQLAVTLTERASVRPEVTTLWRDTRTDFVAASTQPDDEVADTDALDGVPVRTIGLVGHARGDALRRRTYLPLRRSTAAHFAGELAPPLVDPVDGIAVVHAFRLGREHLALRGLREANALDRPFVLTAHHHPRWSGRFWPDPVWRHLYRQADAVVALTNAEATLLADLGVAPDRIVVTGIGAVLAEHARRPTPLPETVSRFILFLGQQYPYKRLDRAVAAFGLLARGDAALHLVVAGPPHADTAALVAASPFADRIHVVGDVDDAGKRWLLEHAVALIFPSEQESFGGVVVDAGGVGCPVVVGAVPAVVEVTQRLDWGLSTDGSAGQLAEAARGYLISPPDQPQREAAAARVAATFSWPVLAAQYEALYRRLS
jgi:glycosyltransferase involved in cell wall biosynthesis